MLQIKNFKKALLTFIALLLIAGMLTMFVACDNPDNSDGNNNASSDNSENNSTVESELKDGRMGTAILEALYGYTVKTFAQKSEAYNESVFSGTGYGVSRYVQSLGEGSRGYFFTYDNNGEGTYPTVYLFFYDSENHAINAKQNELTELLEDYNFCTQIGKTVIMSTSEELWDVVKNCKMPDTGTYLAYEKILSALAKPYGEIFIEDIFDRREQTLKEVEFCEITVYPEVGNCYESYKLFPSDDSDGEAEFISQIGALYTDDSYIMNKGDVFEAYSKMKPGLHFQLNGEDESYTVIHFFTENDIESLIIPSTYNGKPVTRISRSSYLHSSIKSITIPHSVIDISNMLDGSQITDIYYNGTKTEWAEVRVSYYPDSKIPVYTVHCTDGEIVPNQD